jgi:hypothetical protein
VKTSAEDYSATASKAIGSGARKSGEVGGMIDVEQEPEKAVKQERIR